MISSLNFTSFYKKILFLLFLSFGFLVTSYAEVIITNSGDDSVTCQYGANPVLPDQIFTIEKYKTLGSSKF